MLSLLDCSFAIPIRNYFMLSQDCIIPFLFQYAVFEYLYIQFLSYSNTPSSKTYIYFNYWINKIIVSYLYCYIVSKKIFLLYRIFQICFFIIFSMPLFSDAMFSLRNISPFNFNFPHIFIWFFVPFSSTIHHCFRFCIGHVFFCFFSRWFLIFVW